MEQNMMSPWAMIDTAWIIELALMALSWVILGWREKKIWKFPLRVLGMFLILGMAKILLSYIMGTFSSSFGNVWNLVHGILGGIFVYVFSPYQRKNKVLLWLTLLGTMLSITSLSGQCSILYGTYIRSGYMEGVVRCLIYCLMPLVALFLRRLDFDEFAGVPRSGVHLVGTLCICAIIIGIVESYFYNIDDKVHMIFAVMYACLVVTSMGSAQALYTMCKEQKDLNDLRLEKGRYLAEREINRIAEVSLEDLRCIRHDLKNQYSYLQILLEEERYDDLKDYFHQLQEHLPEQLNLIDCGNRTVNTVLNMKFSKAHSPKIKLEHQLVVPPVLPFRDEHICSILANLLDNAVDECTKLVEKGVEDTRIRLEIYPHQSYLYIRCMNSTDLTSLKKESGGIRTTKKDLTLHGYGTKIVARLAEKYNGCADYSLEDGMFTATVMLDMTGGK